ncbi:MAG TPA: VOC family protein [Dyella sp.]|nr:VOC family protein [Dyella sp.]
MAGVRGVDHINLRAPAPLLEKLRRFYIDIIGLEEGSRPTFRSGSRGYWLYAGDKPIVHLTAHGEDDAAAQSTGWFNHVAFDCADLRAVRARLDAADIPYRIDVVDMLEQVQLFLTDPAGIRVELNFSRTTL